ncbi:MAG: SIMPL domain-containing protein [Chloroflexi bacterium]|nr:SIMPL domain-containing protein [Chloroflexota bacterium]
MIQAVIRSKKMLVLLGAALVLLLAVACSTDGSGEGSPGNISELLSAVGGSEAAAQLLRGGSGASTGIWVNGTGKATGDPDLGILSLGVEALADTASEARGMAADAIAKTILVLKSNNVQDRDMQTSRFSISPRYTTHEVTRCTDRSVEGEPTSGGASLGMPAPGFPDVVEMIVIPVEMIVIPEEKGSECRVEFERVLIGYQVTNTLTVKVRDLDKMGDIIDGATEAAGNLVRINRVSFTIEDTKPLQNEAREEAIADLLTKANAMAALAGVELGKLVFLTESGGGVPQSFARLEAVPAFGFASQSTSILAGELDVNVSVQGVFAIAP